VTPSLNVTDECWKIASRSLTPSLVLQLQTESGVRLSLSLILLRSYAAEVRHNYKLAGNSPSACACSTVTNICGRLRLCSATSLSM